MQTTINASQQVNPPIDTMVLECVEYMPEKELMKPGVLYFSEAYGTTAHLCACGNCNWEVNMPIVVLNHVPLTKSGCDEGWILNIGLDGKPTVRPSVGNWQYPCRSHYYISDGKIDWL